MFKAEDAKKLTEEYFENTYRNSSWYKDFFETIKREASNGIKYYEYKTYTASQDRATGKVILPKELQFITNELETLGYTTELKGINNYYCARNDENCSIVQLIIHW